jgi:hypothetical protein
MSEHFTGCSTNSYPSTGSRGWAYKIGERSTIGGKDHILPVDLAENNLLAPVREEILAHVKATGIDLHKYFHHLNSSQAFALNLFYPFFERGQSKVLLRALGQRGIARDWAFERVWDKAEGTNVDVCWRLTRQCQRDTNFFCEVKLTEQKFGTAEPDADHLRKLQQIYTPRFKAAGCDPELLTPAHFFGKYQLLRNIWLAAESADSQVLFLLPWENPVLWNQIAKVRPMLSPMLNESVHAISIEDVLIALAHAAGPAWIVEYVLQLQEKYLLRLD